MTENETRRNRNELNSQRSCTLRCSADRDCDHARMSANVDCETRRKLFADSLSFAPQSQMRFYACSTMFPISYIYSNLPHTRATSRMYVGRLKFRVSSPEGSSTDQVFKNNVWLAACGYQACMSRVCRDESLVALPERLL